MHIEPDISRVAALIGEPSRTALLTVLLDGASRPAGELAAAAGVSPTAASGHLAKLVEGRLLLVETVGRHRYYRLAGPEVATAVEALAQLTDLPLVLRAPRLPPVARALRVARCCYDHLAGEFAVAVAAALEARGYLIRGEGRAYHVGGEEARRWFARQGADLALLRPSRSGPARQCLDWTERQPHLAGPLGSALFSAWCEAGWLRRGPARLVEVTALGRRKFLRELGITPGEAAFKGMTPHPAAA